MPRFRYTALDTAGKRTRGVIEASDETALANQFRRQRFLLLRAVEISHGRSLLDRLHAELILRRGLSKSAVAQFTRELSVMLEAGQDVDRALRFLVETSANTRARTVLQALRDCVRSGKSLAASLSEQPAVFPRLYIALVRAGESGGNLAEALSHLADLLEREAKLQASVQSALTYPALLVISALGTIVMLLTYVLPQFTPIFAQAGAQLPLATRILIGIGDMVQAYGTLMLAVFLAGCLGFYRALRKKEVQLATERVVLRLPIAGALVKRSQAACFTRTLGTLLRDGVGLVPALGIAHDVLGNLTAAQIVDRATSRVRAGARLAASLGEGEFFPPQTIHLIQLGEETGRLAEMALRAANIHDEQVHHSVNRMVSLLVPAVTIVMGLIVAEIVGSLLVAMLSLNDIAT